MDHLDDFPELELVLVSAGADADSDIDLWNELDDEVDLELELSDDDLLSASEPIQDANFGASCISDGEEDDLGVNEAEPESSEDENDARDETLKCLEVFVLSFLTKLSDALPGAYSQVKGQLSNQIKITLQLADRTKESFDDNMPMRSLVFPRATKDPSARPFAQLFRIIDLIHEALVTGVPVTKRDIYYNDVQLFRSQATVDRLIDDLAATLHLTRADLNVRASSKGLICGSGITIHLQSGETLEISDRDASLIPQAEDIERFAVARTLAWVLVVEKEAVFQTLCKLRLATHQAFSGSGLIVTGKGYPDVATRQLVKTLSDNLPAHVPILALVDGDAYGIDILSVYKHGSTRMRHENDHLVADRLQWVGLWATELASYVHTTLQGGRALIFHLASHETVLTRWSMASLGIEKDVLLPITKHDEKKARTLLKRANLPAQWRKELQHMLFSRRKAEIEVLGAAWLRPVEGVADLVATDDPLRLPDRPQAGRSPGTPLLRYLIRKIRQACADSACED